MVAVGGHGVDQETVRLACRMAARRRSENRGPGELYAVHVIEVDRSLPLSAPSEAEVEEGERVLATVEQVAAEHELEVETEMVQAREVGPAIVSEATDWHADLLVMGLPYKRRFGQFDLGRTAPYILRNAPCRVILFRERLEG